ncbi:hypothetical protein WICPIJ_002345 [Wickerhamomyces pijperi]|uniref:Uncharacterized protein n=1 Tax=Wickerhamomyces pijperi TaxID=599730 RepID=A0A9P8TPS4_WICPI|nr:hypothetical protein WICPIJ_002345 [Wickerhamomyces pijperi]
MNSCDPNDESSKHGLDFEISDLFKSRTNNSNTFIRTSWLSNLLPLTSKLQNRFEIFLVTKLICSSSGTKPLLIAMFKQLTNIGTYESKSA